jgi:hypothetical protein
LSAMELAWGGVSNARAQPRVLGSPDQSIGQRRYRRT